MGFEAELGLKVGALVGLGCQSDLEEMGFVGIESEDQKGRVCL